MASCIAHALSLVRDVAGPCVALPCPCRVTGRQEHGRARMWYMRPTARRGRGVRRAHRARSQERRAARSRAPWGKGRRGLVQDGPGIFSVGCSVGLSQIFVDDGIIFWIFLCGLAAGAFCFLLLFFELQSVLEAFHLRERVSPQLSWGFITSRHALPAYIAGEATHHREAPSCCPSSPPRAVGSLLLDGSLRSRQARFGRRQFLSWKTPRMTSI